VVYRHLPAQGHSHAVGAVRASECAAVQGRFAAMHAALSRNADSIGVKSWAWFARAAAVPDSAQFAADANRLRIRGTPTIMVHNQRYDGLPPFDSLLAYVDRARSSRDR
jgi:protein-disulfide isomerase